MKYHLSSEFESTNFSEQNFTALKKLFECKNKISHYYKKNNKEFFSK